MQSYEGNGALPGDWRLLPLAQAARTESCNSKLIKGRLPSQPAEGLFPAYSASGQDVWCPTAEHKGEAVIISAVGARCGKCFLASGEWSAIANTHILWPKQDVIDARFLWLLVNDEKFWIRGQSAQPFVQVGATKEKRVVVPPLSEQRKIAAVLGLVQRAVEQQERIIGLVTELKKALLHKLFTEGLRGEPQEQTEIGPVPRSWEVKPLGKVAKFRTGGTPSRTNPDYWENGDVPWVKTTEIDYRVIETTEEKISRKGLENSSARVFPKGTLLVAMYGQGVTRGRAGILGIDAATNQACAAISPHQESELSTQFIYYFLQYHYERLRQMGHGANQRNLNMALLRGFPIAFPPSDEQAGIVGTLDCLDRKVRNAERKASTLGDLFRTVLHELMTARIRVNDLDVEGILGQAVRENGDRLSPNLQQPVAEMGGMP